MLKIIGTLVLMIICGTLAYVAALAFLMNLGSKLHQNYEYYGSSAALVFVYGAGLAGFLTPGIVVYHQRKRERPWQFSLAFLFVLMTLNAIMVGIYAFSH
jgi:hypothetical protein